MYYEAVLCHSPFDDMDMKLRRVHCYDHVTGHVTGHLIERKYSKCHVANLFRYHYPSLLPLPVWLL